MVFLQFFLLSFLLQRIDPWMVSSFLCQILSSGTCSRLCLVLCPSTCSWVCLAFPLPFVLLNAFAFPLSSPRDVAFFIGSPFRNCLRLLSGTVLRAETTSSTFTFSCVGDVVVTIFFKQDETHCSSTRSGWRFESSSFAFTSFLSRHSHKLSCTIRQRTVRSSGLKHQTWVYHH